MMLKRFLTAVIRCAAVVLTGCEKSPSPASNAGVTSVQLTLDWKPEPEFGGFYQANLGSMFTGRGLNVTITPAGAGAPTWQLVATGQTEFATSTSDQVLIARKQGADVIGIFTVYQTFPQGIMVHQSRGFKSIKDVFANDGVLLAENNSWLQFLQKKFSPYDVKIAGYDGGIAQFLAKTDYSQQCFITSEPILAKHQGGDPQTFLIADEGFNPYTTLVICKGDLWRSHPDVVKAMVECCRDGWRAYLDNPATTNQAMSQMNPDMDLQTFNEGAAAQKPLIDTDDTKANGLGTMSLQRWKDMASQLSDLGVIDSAIDPQQCFVNP